MQALVVYYSRTGNTRKVGEAIAGALGCDIEEIVDTANRSGPLGWVNAGRQASLKQLTKLQPIKKDPSQYDIVIIGTPVWAFTMSTPVRTYIAENKDKFKQVAVFVTFNGSSLEKAFREMGAACGKTPAATLAVKSGDIQKGDYADAVKNFAGAIKP